MEKNIIIIININIIAVVVVVVVVITEECQISLVIFLYVTWYYY